ncbi:MULTISPECIES: CAT RNA binding domain-containing protein [unclassified Enterococcus]|uniref:CAT RNA binding domain-containing protein n=1 Tax=unclassified Enterococcus TaxID=2608891 RepID=UPI00259B2CFD|nr:MULTISPECIES: CAT RNA binding domain-containing protein [unclassified Enterococcus]MDO0917997.1 CAT RNA binding domain-containing protein [Enterococcus sp. B1E2]WIV16378.1 CAT RNA binding domain-containing protein [Enterococcus sp. FZMF]
MKIKKFLNNNVVLLKKGSNEIIGFSTGISFNKKVGDDVEEQDFEKIFVLDTHAMLEHFSYQLGKCDPKYVAIVAKIVAYAKQNYRLAVSFICGASIIQQCVSCADRLVDYFCDCLCLYLAHGQRCRFS